MTLAKIINFAFGGGIALIGLSAFGTVQAATIGLNPGEWTRFIFPVVGQPALDTFTFGASSTGAVLKVTDAGASGDVLSLSANGGFIGTTSLSRRGSSCGFSPEACFNNPSMSSGSFDFTTSGTKEVEVTSIAGASPGIGGAGYMRVETSFINLYGTSESRSDFINILNSESDGVSFYTDDSTATFGQDKAVPLYAELTSNITDLNTFGRTVYDLTSGISYASNPDKSIDLLLGYNLPSINVGGACINSSGKQDPNYQTGCTGSYSFQALDLADIVKFPSGGGSLFDTPSSLLAHELIEAGLLSTGLSFNSAHNPAISQQNAVLTEVAGGQRDTSIGSRSLPSGVDPSRTYTYYSKDDGIYYYYPADDTAYYIVSDTEKWMLFPWTATGGEQGWESIVLKSSGAVGAVWEIADLKSGIYDTGVPWSGRDIDISIDSVSFTAASNTQPVPEPASILGTLAFAAFGGKKLLKRKQEKTA